MTLSKSEAGKLNTANSIEITKQKLAQNILAYSLIQKLHKPFSGHVEYRKRQNKFCSSLCSATFKNTITPMMRLTICKVPT